MRGKEIYELTQNGRISKKMATEITATFLLDTEKERKLLETSMDHTKLN